MVGLGEIHKRVIDRDDEDFAGVFQKIAVDITWDV